MDESTADLPRDGQNEHQDPYPRVTDLPTHRASKKRARIESPAAVHRTRRLFDDSDNEARQLQLLQEQNRVRLERRRQQLQEQPLAEQDIISSQDKRLQGQILEPESDDWTELLDPARRHSVQSRVSKRHYRETKRRLASRPSDSIQDSSDVIHGEVDIGRDDPAFQGTHVHHMYPSFVYCSIGRDQIRILEVLPGRRSDPLNCKIRTVSLFGNGDGLTYESLSYCWYDGRNHSRPVIIDGEVLSVSATLFDALQQLRDPGVSRRVWVDAICINQADEAEKALQIKLMRHIYSDAVGVIIWLGEYESSSNGGSMGLGDHYSMHRKREVALLAAMNKETETKDLSERALNWTTEELELVLGICARPWFERLWIVQELCLPKRVMVQFGSIRLTWGKLVACIEQATEAAMVLDLQLSSIRLETRLAMLKFARNHWQSASNSASCTLLSQLAILRGRACSLPADHIFGMLAICKDGADDIQISYDKPHHEVYLDATLHCLRQGGLKVLSMCRWTADQMTATTVPSWVPDWSRRVRADEPPYFAVVVGQNNQQSKYNACGNTKSEHRFDAGANTLTVEGCIVSEIVRVVPGVVDLDSLQQLNYTAYRAEIQKRTEASLSAWYQEVLNANTGELTEPQNIAFWRTTCALGANMPAPEVKERWFDTWRRSVQGSQENISVRSMLGEVLYSQYTDYIYHVDYVARTRSFFITEDGKLGLASSEARVGDRVAAFVGGEVPFLLRRTEDDHYRLIGECFCHGIMDGEIFQGDWEQRTRNIALR